MSISEFVRRPVPLGLRRARGAVTAVRAARSAATAASVPGGVPVLCLVCTLTGDRAAGLEQAVLARLAGLQTVGTVVLDLGGAAEHRIGHDTVHDCARAAMLAAFAQAPGPGLVGAVMRDALAAPPGTL